MKAKILIFTIILGLMFLWVFQSASAQDNETTENTEKIKELNQQEKQSLLVRIWNYISNNSLLAGVIVVIVVFAVGVLGAAIRRFIRRKKRKKPSLPVVQPPSQPLPTGLPEIAREALREGRGVTIETEDLKMTISPAMDGITELTPEETPVKAKKHIEDGDRFFHKDKFKESAASYDKARKTARDLKDEKSSALAYLGKGAALCGQGKYKQAISILTECTNYLEGEALARTYFNRGVAYYELKDYKEAVSDWDKAIEINPQYAVAYNNRGVAYGELKDYKKEIEDYDKAIEINPQDAVAYYNRGVAYGNLKDYKKAIDNYDKAIEINPQYAVAYYNRGVAYDGLKDYEKAFEDFDKAIEINPQDAMGYNNRGVAYGGLKDYKKAIEDYDKAIEINPQYAVAYNNRGVAYGELGKTDKEIEDYTKAIEINPQDAEAYYNLAWAYALRKQQGDKERMIYYLEKAIELDDEYKKKAKEDDDFKDYWGDPEFERLVE